MSGLTRNWNLNLEILFVFKFTGSCWSSGLEHQSHDNLGMLKVEGLNFELPSIFRDFVLQSFEIQGGRGKNGNYKRSEIGRVESHNLDLWVVITQVDM